MTRQRWNGQLSEVQRTVGRKGDRCTVRETRDSPLSDASCGVWKEIAKTHCAGWDRDQQEPVWVGKGSGERWDSDQDL